MLYVQFDAEASVATGRVPPANARAQIRARHLDDVLDGLELRASEPAIMVLRAAVVLALGPEAIASRTWTDRGLDGARGFALVMGERAADARFPLGIAAFARDGERLARWVSESGLVERGALGDRLLVGDARLATLADEALTSAWIPTLASDEPYLDLVASFGHGRRAGGLWVAATRRGSRFQVEAVAELPGLPPLHVIARDPPEGVAEVIPPGHEPPVQLRASASAAVVKTPEKEGPPSWDEPGPCDCGVPPDLCAMKRFRLAPVEGAPASELPGADIFRQLTASIIDLHEVRASHVGGLFEGDRVLVARSPESIAALREDDVVLDASGIARAKRDARAIVGQVLAVVPWPAIFEKGAFSRTFSGLW
jgi:hypothetical protein